MNYDFSLDVAPLFWFWISYDPGRETATQYRLEDQGYETYLPWCQTAGHAPEPLLPFYMALGAREPQWAVILSTFGVEGVLTGASRFPVACKAEIIDELRSRENGEPVKVGNNRWEREIRPIMLGSTHRGLANFERGESVEITDGSLIGRTGIFDRFQGEERAVLFVALFGRMTPVTVARDALAKAAAAKKREACRKGGCRGGPARAQALSAPKRRAIAEHAARARWAR